MKLRSQWILVLLLIMLIFCGCKSNSTPDMALSLAGNVDPDVHADKHIDNDKEKLLDMALKISGKKLSAKERGMVMRMLNLNEKDVIKGLTACAELSDGRYPSSLDHKTVIRQTEAWGLVKYGKYDSLSDDKKKEIEKKMYDTFYMTSYYRRLIKKKKDPAYYGDRVTVEDSDAVLVRWKESEGKHRVIFGDLRIETVAAEELAELEKLSSK